MKHNRHVNCLTTAHALVVFVGLSACQSVDPREPVLSDMVNRAILPTYATLVAKAETLQGSLATLCEAPTRTRLLDAQSAWSNLRETLKQSEAFAFGPVVDQRIDSAIDFWPTRPDRIEAAIANIDDNNDVGSIDSLGANARGTPAIEYLVFGATRDVDDVLDQLRDTDAGAKRCAFLVALGDDVASQTAALEQAWIDDDSGYAEQFLRAGKDSDVYPTALSAIEEVINTWVGFAETIQGKKIGAPLGKRSGGEPMPEIVESPYSDDSISDLLNNLAGIRLLYGATDAANLSYAQTLAVYIRDRSAEVNSAFYNLLWDFEQLLLSFEIPLREAVVDDPERVEQAYELAMQLQRIIAVDLANQLSATVTFTDNDGD